ncbi:IRF3 factor, partial [Scytalopus superciliaris]|nr:IRF3 factor [Scytalopus superciliaris]
VPARRDAPRVRFGPWLLRAISSGCYRGLRWLDAGHTTFRVPWKHNARKDISSSDLEVFKVGGMGVTARSFRVFRVGVPPLTVLHPQAWARVSGRYEEASEDPAKWKTNFRCALRSTRMFKLLRDHSKCGEDPHKVF